MRFTVEPTRLLISRLRILPHRDLQRGLAVLLPHLKQVVEETLLKTIFRANGAATTNGMAGFEWSHRRSRCVNALARAIRCRPRASIFISFSKRAGFVCFNRFKSSIDETSGTLSIGMALVRSLDIQPPKIVKPGRCPANSLTM
jgi:hypothetical protein